MNIKLSELNQIETSWVILMLNFYIRFLTFGVIKEMNSSGHYEAVLDSKNSMNKILNDYSKCCRDYEACLSPDEMVEYNAVMEEYS